MPSCNRQLSLSTFRPFGNVTAGVELPVGKLRVGVVFERLRRFSLALQDQLIVLHADLQVLLGNTRNNGPEMQRGVTPSGLYYGAERPLISILRHGSA